jgi:hypothetical protein
MVDQTGISLSVSDPDNLNNPSSYGDGGSGDAEDYCTAELLHGDVLASMLEISRNSGSPAAVLTRGSIPRRIRGGSAGVQKHGILILVGILVVVVIGVAILNEE